MLSLIDGTANLKSKCNYKGQNPSKDLCFVKHFGDRTVDTIISIQLCKRCMCKLKIPKPEHKVSSFSGTVKYFWASGQKCQIELYAVLFFFVQPLASSRNSASLGFVCHVHFPFSILFLVRNEFSTNNTDFRVDSLVTTAEQFS